MKNYIFVKRKKFIIILNLILYNILNVNAKTEKLKIFYTNKNINEIQLKHIAQSMRGKHAAQKIKAKINLFAKNKIYLQIILNSLNETERSILKFEYLNVFFSQKI